MPEEREESSDSPQFVQLYDELRGIAAAMMRDERRGHTLQPTALVSEAYLRLLKEGRIDGGKRKFFLDAAEAMRRILIEHGRKRGAQKRGSGIKPISLESLDVIDLQHSDEILILDDAILRLQQKAPEEAQVVRLRFYAGLNMEEIAQATGMSISTVKRAWRYARAWLWRELNNR